nr:immunoglobulin heavy chain junction region [Mus musculus]NSM03908.1 immunoglobulin heavy chain junction region [Mus musculus]NSM03955.1 immunoglobulin heavy chain junction region [Mus musculus]NSM04322.1 immunoglobulin heavy chain junction region [Mus musculus]NSM04506.1 immunoglobulin heavy chain junction region [Mus musculus]
CARVGYYGSGSYFDYW